jgi:hypothetical protein
VIEVEFCSRGKKDAELAAFRPEPETFFPAKDVDFRFKFASGRLALEHTLLD